MKPLLDAIIAKFTAAGLGTTVTGGIHVGKAKTGAAMPYLVVTPLAAPLELAYGTTSDTYSALMQFALFGPGLTTQGTNTATVLTAYDNTTLTLASRTNYCMIRLGEPVPMLQPAGNPERDQNTADVWGFYWTYRYDVI